MDFCSFEFVSPGRPIQNWLVITPALTLPQNNRLVEGKVNKLKRIKRMGYGRAGCALLRQRVLHAL